MCFVLFGIGSSFATTGKFIRTRPAFQIGSQIFVKSMCHEFDTTHDGTTQNYSWVLKTTNQIIHNP